jgi:hypothetical protein
VKKEKTMELPPLSNGLPPTLGSYKTTMDFVFGPDSKASAFLEKKISESKNGADELVVVNEQQMIGLLMTIELGSANASE